MAYTQSYVYVKYYIGMIYVYIPHIVCMMDIKNVHNT